MLVLLGLLQLWSAVAISYATYAINKTKLTKYFFYFMEIFASVVTLSAGAYAISLLL